MGSPTKKGQCAADNTVVESKIVPLHPYFMDTCHGIGEGASSPPIILLILFINVGMAARKWSFNM